MPVGTGAAAIKAQVKREMEAEKRAAQKAREEAQLYQPLQEVFHEAAPVCSVSGVFFKCPMVGPAVLNRADMENYIQDFLWGQLAEEPEMTSAMMIQTLNRDREKVKNAVGIISKYIDNIMAHPNDEKFRKIRINNKSFQEKVAPLNGVMEFLQALGFEQKQLPGPQEIDEDYMVMDELHAIDLDRLQSLKDVLHAAEPIRPELDRNLKVIHPSVSTKHMEVPEEFYNIHAEDIKREHQMRQEAVERMGMLRTKEMREREQMRELRRYRFCLIRIRFPDGPLLQGTFRALEKFTAVREFVRECLENDWMPFILSTQTGHRLTDDQLSIAELSLAPASIINFAWDPAIMLDVARNKGSIEQEMFLKEDLLAQMQTF